jgi:hypothetical protein
VEDRERGRRRRGDDERAVGDGMRVRVRRGVLRGVSGEEQCGGRGRLQNV